MRAKVLVFAVRFPAAASWTLICGTLKQAKCHIFFHNNELETLRYISPVVQHLIGVARRFECQSWPSYTSDWSVRWLVVSTDAKKPVASCKLLIVIHWSAQTLTVLKKLKYWPKKIQSIDHYSPGHLRRVEVLAISPVHHQPAEERALLKPGLGIFQRAVQ